MKALSIRQPWATLICKGIKNVENRTWKTNYRGKLLIHASSYKCPKDFVYRLPLELCSPLCNEITYGSIKPDDFISGAIIGYVDLVDCIEGDYDSLWAEPDCVKFIFENAYIFDKPITGVKGKLNIFEYNLDENNLPPAHQAPIPKVYIEDDKIVLPASNELFEEIKKTKGPKEFELYLDNAIEKLFVDEKCDEDGLHPVKKLENIKTVCIVSEDDEEEHYKFLRTELYSLENDKGETIVEPSIYGGEREVWCVVIFFE
jgi:hypothetical protein